MNVSANLNIDPSDCLVPVAVFAFRRVDHLRETLAALERCSEFDRTPVTIFSDGARPEIPGEQQAVAEVRSFLNTWARIHGADVHEASENQGLRRSITFGVTAMLQRHDRVIVLEDDIIVSPAFLKYMNQGLNACENRHDIYQICGYMVPHQLHLPDVGLTRVGTCWGWATWRRAWCNYNDNATELLSRLPLEQVSRFNIDDTCSNYSDLAANANGTMNTWAVRWDASIFLQNGLSVLPSQSLTRNIGFGGGATNCEASGVGKHLMRQEIRETAICYDWSSLEIVETPGFLHAIKTYNRWQTAQWTKRSMTEKIRGRLRRLLKFVFAIGGNY
jgi:hypothetical protein